MVSARLALTLAGNERYGMGNWVWSKVTVD